MSKDVNSPVHKRKVFYIPGYDPIHPRRYRELYRKESAAQADISGYKISQSRKVDGGRFGWNAQATIDGIDTQSDFEVMLWSDIVRHSMENSIVATYGQLLKTCWVYVSTGAFFRLMRLRKGPALAALYPVVMLLAQLALAVVTGLVAGAMASLTGVPGISWIGVLPAWYTLVWFHRHDNKLYAYYLMHDYAFTARHCGAYPTALQTRLVEFEDALQDALESDVDEVLVVGHSSGAHLAVSLLAALQRKQKLPANGPAVALLTLGHVVPMVSFLPDAKVLRRDLHDLSSSDAVTWVDVSAPGDGCSFALCDPVAVSGAAPESGKKWPLVLSAAFTQTLKPETWKSLRWRFFRLHFQYLCAFDRPRDYDYFKITAGPRSLQSRFADRAPSKNRIEVARSAYTSRAA